MTFFWQARKNRMGAQSTIVIFPIFSKLLTFQRTWFSLFRNFVLYIKPPCFVVTNCPLLIAFYTGTFKLNGMKCTLHSFVLYFPLLVLSLDLSTNTFLGLQKECTTTIYFSASKPAADYIVVSCLTSSKTQQRKLAIHEFIGGIEQLCNSFLITILLYSFSHFPLHFLPHKEKAKRKKTEKGFVLRPRLIWQGQFGMVWKEKRHAGCLVGFFSLFPGITPPGILYCTIVRTTTSTTTRLLSSSTYALTCLLVDAPDDDQTGAGI